MTTTLKAIRDRMYLMDPSVGRSLSIASLTTVTVVVTALATGIVDASRYVGKWLRRRDTATAADLIRLTSNYASSTGTLTHAGANYTDTTATGETVEITEFEPFLIDNAVMQALRKQRRIDRSPLPTIHGVRRYFLHDFSWIESPSDIVKVCWRPSRELGRNRYFDKWNAYSSAGALVPDHWTLAGSGATFARSTTQTWKGQYSLAITRSGTNATATQDIGLLESGSGENLRGRTVTVVLRGWADTASALRVQLLDGVTTTSSDYHTGGSSWEELTASATIGATATNVQIRVTVDADSTCYAGEAFPVENSLDDAVRWDSMHERDITEQVDYEQGNGTLALITPKSYGIGSQIVIYSHRGYPELDLTRQAAGTADSDVIDAPLVMTAYGGLAHLFEAEARRRGVDTSKADYTGRQYMEKWEQMVQAHAVADDDRGGGMELPRMPAPFIPRRIR